MHSRTVGVLLACFLLFTASAAATTARETAISGVEVQGPGFAAVEDDTTFVWQNETTTVNVTVTTGDISEPNHEVCVRAPALEEGQRELGCGYRRLESNSTTTIAVPISEWPDAAVGKSLSLEVTLTEALTGTRVDGTNTSVTVITSDGQFDGDQLSNERELELGTNVSAQDTDGDGLWDDQEVNSVGSSPLSKDTDEDGVPDAVEVNYGTNTTLADTDGDNLRDAAEINDYSTDPLDSDSDDDGLSDGHEANNLDSSPTAPDTDGDGVDDPTEEELDTAPDDPDSDDDRLTDGEENTQYSTDPLESDTDGDGVADGREIHDLGTNPRVADADSDGDLLSDTLELRLGTNPATALSPWGYVVILVGAGAVVGMQVYRAGWRVEREQRTVRGRTVRVPTITRTGRPTGPALLADSESPRRADLESGQSAERHPGAGESGDAAAGETSPSGGDAADADAGDSPNEPLEIPDQAFLTDADRVKELLREAGGNCRQQDIVLETGWSKSKVSRLLSQMADDDEVRKISLGRENVIVLPGEEPDAVRSALDDE